MRIESTICSWRQTIISFEAAGVRFKDNGIDEKKMTVIIDKYITIYCIKNIM